MANPGDEPADARTRRGHAVLRMLGWATAALTLGAAVIAVAAVVASHRPDPGLAALRAQKMATYSPEHTRLVDSHTDKAHKALGMPVYSGSLSVFAIEDGTEPETLVEVAARVATADGWVGHYVAYGGMQHAGWTGEKYVDGYRLDLGVSQDTTHVSGGDLVVSLHAYRS
jgi:hypothetical protein